MKTEKTETVKEIVKKEIPEILKISFNPTVKKIHENLISLEIVTSLDTVRKAVSELTEEKIIIKSGDKKSGFTFSNAPIQKKRGWKTQLIKKLAQQAGGSVKRSTLAKMICSDERNTHILISCIMKSWDGPRITWDKKLKIYNF